MADVFELPETSGRPSIRNPFESPSDYHHLHESLVPSSSVFKGSKASSAVSRGVAWTPAKFKWSIEEMSNLLPVHIDPEDIHRQALYLSQARTDSELEEKHQNAIEQFFTKGAIVPSPWGPLATKPSIQPLRVKCSSKMEEPQSAKKINAACQTILSLPVDFNLEKVLGDYYKTEEVSEQVQESLSSSSLSRKLFLDGHISGSESTPSSPDKEVHDGVEDRAEPMSSVIVSPLKCEITATTPSSGQFLSSPIQGQGRAYSLGSVASPVSRKIFSSVSFPHRVSHRSSAFCHSSLSDKPLSLHKLTKSSLTLNTLTTTHTFNP